MTIESSGAARTVPHHPDLYRRPSARHPVATAVALGVFTGGALATNWLTTRYGLISVGFGLTATAGSFPAGIVLLARDWVHDLTGRTTVLACIVVGALASAATTNPRLALASAVAFTLSETVDLLVYTPLRRQGRLRAALASNLVGAPVDTLVFLTLAGLPVWAAMPGQLTAKTTATLLPLTAIWVLRAVLRHRVRSPRP
jgi:uncharacterized PurR-regulated membrane protein YhhQ (DUF165 family)